MDFLDVNPYYHETYQDKLVRLFPNEQSPRIVGENGYSRNITLQVTEACDLRCTYCYLHDKSPARMSLETGKKFIDLILASDERSKAYMQSRESSGCVLEFIGGEPLLEIDLIDELTDYFIQRMIELDHPWLTRYMISMASNGMHYFEDKVQKYIKKNAGHFSLSISIDGNKQLHDMCRLDAQGNGTYDRAAAAAAHYAEHYGVPVGTKMTIAPSNLQFLDQALIEFLAQGVRTINVNVVYEKGWTLEHAQEKYQRLKKVADYILDHDLEYRCFVSVLDNLVGIPYGDKKEPWCGGNGLMLICDPRGDLYPCIRYTPSSVGHNVVPYKIGDVDHGFCSTPEEAERIKCMACITRQSQCEKTEHCLDCPIAAGCGDCAGYSYEIYGEVGHRTTFICDMHKARSLVVSYYRNKAALKNHSKTPLPVNCPKEWAVPIIGEDEYNMLVDLAEKAKATATE